MRRMFEEFSKGVESRQVFTAPWEKLEYPDGEIGQMDIIWRCPNGHGNGTQMQMMEFQGRYEPERYWYLREHLCDTCGKPASFEECARAHDALKKKVLQPAIPMHPGIRQLIDGDPYVKANWHGRA